MRAALFLALIAWADGPPAGPVVGQVLDVEGNPLPGLTVALAKHDAGFPLWRRIEHRAESDADGRFAFPALKAGGAYDVSPMASPGRPLPAAFVYREGVVEVTLIPGVSNPGRGSRTPVAATLKGRDGRPIVPPAEPEAARRSFACRVVDKATGAPIAGADVTFGVEEVKDQQGEDAFGSLDRHATRTDAEGRYLVTIPTRYLPPIAPEQAIRARVTIRHPGYLDWFTAVDAREIATRGASGDFPDFLAPKLPASRAVTGRLLGPDGTPLPDVAISKDYGLGPLADYPRDGEMAKTDAEGRFWLKVPIGRAILLDFRASQAAKQHFPVAADATELGDLRLTRGPPGQGAGPRP